MAKTLANLKTRILALLDDADGGTYGDALVTEAAQAAIRQATEYYPKLAKVTVTSIDATFRATLPADVHSVDAVLDLESFNLMPKAGLTVGDFHGENIEVNDWHLYSAGYVTFSKEPESGVDIFYRAFYTEPTLDEDTLDTPDILFNMLAYRGCFECCMSAAASAANIRQFNTKVDSGTPVHNPLIDMAKYFNLQYHNAAKMLPDLEKPSVVA